MSKITDPAETYSGLSDLADAQARLGDIEAALNSALSIGEGKSSAAEDLTDGQPWALIRIAMEQKEAGNLVGARETLRLAYESVRKHPKMRGPSGRLFQVAEMQIQLDDLDGALRSVAAVERGRKAETLASIGLAQAITGETEKARSTLKAALQDAEFAREHPPGPEIVFRPPPKGTSLPLEQIRRLAMVQGTAGQIEKALETARSIPDPSWKRWALTDIVLSRAKAGDLPTVLRLALSYQSPEERRQALENLADGLSARLDLEKVLIHADRGNRHGE
jgi:hypothetical protein